MKQFSLLEIVSTATVLLAMVVESSRVFHAVDSAALQAAHMCTPAPYGMLTALPTVPSTHLEEKFNEALVNAKEEVHCQSIAKEQIPWFCSSIADQKVGWNWSIFGGSRPSRNYPRPASNMSISSLFVWQLEHDSGRGLRVLRSSPYQSLIRTKSCWVKR